jgi:Coenzyme PQQ synthesis protein D (PqqD)
MWRRRPDPLEQVNVLDLVPVRAAESEEKDGRIVVIRPAPFTRGFRGAIDRILHELSARRIRFDEHGSFVWRHIDGTRTTGEIAALLRREYGEGVEPVEARVGKLVQVMYREDFVRYEAVEGGEGR